MSAGGKIYLVTKYYTDQEKLLVITVLCVYFYPVWEQ